MPWTYGRNHLQILHNSWRLLRCWNKLSWKAEYLTEAAKSQWTILFPCLPNRCAPDLGLHVMDAKTVINFIKYTRIVSVSFLLLRGIQSAHGQFEWESTVHQRFVPFSASESNVLTNRTSAGSIAILVRSDSWDVQWLTNFTSRSSIPSLHLIKRSELFGLKNGIPSGSCTSWRDIRLSLKQWSPFIVCYCQIYISVIDSIPINLQGSQFLVNYTLRVCSCVEWVHVGAPHFHESWRVYSLICALSLTCIWTWCWGKWVSHKTWWPPVQLVHRHFLHQVIMTIRTWAAWNKNRSLTCALPTLYISVWIGIFAAVCIFLRTVRCQHWVFQVSIFLTTGYLLPHPVCHSFSVGPSPFTPYSGCHLTRGHPIIFVCWVLFLFYDTGAHWNNEKRNALKEHGYSSDVDINRHSSLGSLWAHFNVDSASQLLRCILQIAHQIDPISWKLCTEMVSPIWFTLSSLSFKGLSRSCVLPLCIW